MAIFKDIPELIPGKVFGTPIDFTPWADGGYPVGLTDPTGNPSFGGVAIGGAAAKPAETAATGVKYDSGKNRMDLIPPEAVEALASVLTFGAKKYADRNWEKGMDWGKVFGATMRHLWAWWKGKGSDKDDETGFSHLWHAFCCIAFLIAYEQRKVGKDDRANPA